MTPLILEQANHDIVLSILRRYIPNMTVWAFGSRAGGKTQKYSDLDLAVVGSEPIPHDIYDHLTEAFDDSELPIRVDLLDWNHVDDSFKPYILENHVVLT